MNSDKNTRKSVTAILFAVMMIASVLAVMPAVEAASEDDINDAIANGLAYLAVNQNPDGSFGSGDTDYKIAQTAEAVLAFENEGHFPGGATLYSANVEDGLDYIFGYAHEMTTVGVSGQPDVDANGNGIGVYFSSNVQRSIYNTGIVMTAIVGSNTPDRVVTTGSQAGSTYEEVMIDTVDYVAFGQNDAGTAKGGWRYYANYGSSDNSVSQWPVLGLIAAEQWGIIAPAFVKEDLNIWIDYIQNDVSGGSGYRTPIELVNVAKTGALLIEQYYVGDTKETPRVIAAVDYIDNNWGEIPSGWGGNKGNYYAMYGVFKGLELLDIGTIPLPDGTFDWHDDYTDYLVGNQLGDGSWPVGSYGSIVLSTDWAILILQGTVFPIEITVDVMDSDCGAFLASVPVKVDYSVERFPVNGKLEIFEDEVLIDQVDLENFIGTATYTNTFESDVVGEHTYKAVLTVTTLDVPPVTVSAEDSTTVEVYEGPVIEDIPDQTAPFTPFDLDDYLIIPDSFFEVYAVGWTASDPGDGWTVGIDLDNVVTVTAPVGASDSKTITFTATTTVTCGKGTSIVRNSDDATFDIKPTPRKIKEDAIEKLKSAKTCDDKVNREIDETIFLINKSLSDKLWINDTHLNPKLGEIVFAKEHAAVEHMQRNAIRMPDEVKAVFEEVINDLLSADEMLSLTSIEEARAYEGTSRMVDKEMRLAEKNLEKAYDEMDDPMDKDNAILRFERAWEHAQRAIRLSIGKTLHTATTNEGGEISWNNYTVTSEEPMPADPVPESATLASFTVGLITLVGYIGIKKKKN